MKLKKKRLANHIKVRQKAKCISPRSEDSSRSHNRGDSTHYESTPSSMASYHFIDEKEDRRKEFIKKFGKIKISEKKC
jgi:hypothetical protein